MLKTFEFMFASYQEFILRSPFNLPAKLLSNGPPNCVTAAAPRAVDTAQQIAWTGVPLISETMIPDKVTYFNRFNSPSRLRRAHLPKPNSAPFLCNVLSPVKSSGWHRDSHIYLFVGHRGNENDVFAVEKLISVGTPRIATFS